MTTVDRFDPLERRITDAIDEIAATRTPDYLTDVLRQTARTSQRPRWSFPERWMPVDTARSRPIFGRPVPLRTIAVLLVLALLTAAVSLYVIGSSRLDPAFGPAGNGLLAYTVENDLYVLEQGGTPRLLASGVGMGPMWSRDGSLMATVRAIRADTHIIASPTAQSGDPDFCSGALRTCVDEIVITDLSGRSMVAATVEHPSWLLDWSPDGRHLLVEAREDGGSCCVQLLTLVAADGAPPETIGPMFGGFNASFTASTSAPIVYLAQSGEARVELRAADHNGQLLGVIATTTIDTTAGNAITFTVSPNGSRIVFGTDTALSVLRIDGTLERSLPFAAVYSARYSPDGRWLLIDGTPDGAMLVAGDGSTRPAPVVTDQSLDLCQWAPDGSLLLCQDAQSALWLVDLERRSATQTSLSSAADQFGIAWQRIPTR